MGKITQELVRSLTPLERESAEWCYERYHQWLGENRKADVKENRAVFVTAIVTVKAYDFKAGELEAFRSLNEKGIISEMEPDEEIGGDCHNITLSQTIVDVHNLLVQKDI